MKKNLSLLVIIPFFIVLCFLSLFSMLDSDRIVSKEENRVLTQRPEFDLADLKSFTLNYSAYITEQFPLRQEMMRVYTEIELACGKKDVRDTYVMDNGWLLPKEYRVADGQAQKYVNAVISAAKDPDLNGISFYYAVLPFKTSMLWKKGARYITNENGEFNRGRLIGAFEGSPIQVIDVSGYFGSAFTAEKIESMYYKTDLHWNARGAFAAAEFIQRAMTQNGISNEEDFEWSSMQGKAYQGDINLRLSNLFDMNEEIPVFKSVRSKNSRYFLSADDERPVQRDTIIGNGVNKAVVSYNDVFTKNFGYYRVENPDAGSGKRILILKDSLQNPTTDVFSSAFSEVDVVDPRYYEEPYGFKELIKKRRIEAVLFMYHQSNFSADLIQFLNN